MSDQYHQFEQRKQQHIDIVLTENTQTSHCNDFNSITLPHDALVNIDFEQVDIASQRFGTAVTTPFLVSSMTAGHHGAVNINHNLMAACQQSGWLMGVGSQRRELTDPDAHQEWHQLKRNFAAVNLLANIGIAQLCQSTTADIQRLIDNIEAKAVIIHLNALQECIQPEGTPQFSGALKAIESLCKQLSHPVIIKETGCGFNQHTLQALTNSGIAAVDVSGLGGTHWGRVEGFRAKHLSRNERTAQTFANWGVSTVQSVQMAASIKPDYEIWGSGGVRNGLDAAKLIALGATSIGLAKPMLETALEGIEQTVELMQTIEYELKTALFCCGCSNLTQLKEKYYAFKN